MNQGKMHVHFMGICGSGCASIAMLAHNEGYIVSGCDQSDESYYAQELKKRNIPIAVGHSASHLSEDVDIVAVSPALFDINPDNEELKEAEKRGILMTWQEFMGSYLQKDKEVIAISGTHGKTTSTFLTAELMIDAGFDPSVIGGSVYKKWGSGGRVGQSNLFLCEADEFNRNFHHYHPTVLVMNNVEMDHPECYNNYEEVLEAFSYFVLNGKKVKHLILNGDSEGAVEVLARTEKDPVLENAEIYVFTRNENADFSQITHKLHVVSYRTEKKEVRGTTFSFILDGEKHTFFMKLYGEYNVSNAVVSVLINKVFGAEDEVLQKSLENFSGVGRRFDLVGECKGVPVFDDYAHHPTEISSVLSMVKDYFPEKNVLAVFEPHQVSRLRLMFQEYADALCIADTVIIGKTHLGREIHKNVKPITPEEWAAASDKILYEEELPEIKKIALQMIDAGKCDLIVVIGAANSYKISRLLCEDNA